MTPDAIIRDSTKGNASQKLSVQLGTETTTLTDELNEILLRAGKAQQSLQVVLALSKFSDATGGHVKFEAKYHYVPVLIGSDSEPVPLFHILEVIDGLVEYAQIQRQLPNLSYVQIDGAISFLRKVAQYNSRNIDFDELEDEAIRSDPAFLEELRQALTDKETLRVLNRD